MTTIKNPFGDPQKEQPIALKTFIFKKLSISPADVNVNITEIGPSKSGKSILTSYIFTDKDSGELLGNNIRGYCIERNGVKKYYAFPDQDIMPLPDFNIV